jgi:hypothetical protein
VAAIQRSAGCRICRFWMPTSGATAEVCDEILELIDGSPPCDVYRLPRRTFKMGRRIRGFGWYPNFR